MACTALYTPTWRRQLDPGDPYGGLNCTAYVAGYAIDYTTCGTKAPTGETIRRLSSEPVPDRRSPGLSLSQVADVAEKFGVPLAVHSGNNALAFDDWVDLIKAGHYSEMLVGYRPIRDSRFRGSETFSGAHALGVPPGFEVQDPLADGRRSGIYRYHQEVYPFALLRSAAEALPVKRLDGTWTTCRGYNGPGHVWAALTPAHSTGVIDPSKPQVIPNWPAPSEKNTMIPEGGLTVTSSHVKSLAQGQPLFRHPGGPVVTKMARAGSVPYLGTAGSGWHAVQVRTGAPYADKVLRLTVLYVPVAAGPIKVK